jgi:hypothetical protein
MRGNTTELGDVEHGPRERFLCFLTVVCPWNQFDWREGQIAGKAPHTLRCLERCVLPLKNRGRLMSTNLAVPITASGLQGS